MRALVIRHDHGSDAAEIGARLRERGYELTELAVVPEDRFYRPDVEFVFPDAAGWDLIAVFGAPWSVYDEQAIGSWLPGELSLLRQAHELGIPLFCVCFGAQALATALDGRTEPSPVPEIGWRTIDSGDEGLVPRGPWFQWHFDHCLPPPGAEVIASNEVCVQAYTIGRGLAVQFHPEITAATVRRWLDLGGREPCRALGIDPGDLLARTRSEESAARERARALVDAFLDKIA